MNGTPIQTFVRITANLAQFGSPRNAGGSCQPSFSRNWSKNPYGLLYMKRQAKAEMNVGTAQGTISSTR